MEIQRIPEFLRRPNGTYYRSGRTVVVVIDGDRVVSSAIEARK